MIKSPVTFAKMYLDHRRHRGARDFRFRPRLRRHDGFDAIDVHAKDATFDATVFVRPGSSDLEAFEQVFLAGHYDLRRLGRYEELARLYRSLAKPLILDLGANVGFASLYFRRAWPAATVVAVEPDRGNIEMVRRNAPAAEAIHAGIASKPCRIKIANPNAVPWAYRTQVASDGDIDAITVSGILESKPYHQPFICKIDIEGAEKELFSQNVEWIQRFPIIVIELHDWFLHSQLTSKNFLLAVAGLDRDFVYLGENIFSVANTHRD